MEARMTGVWHSAPSLGSGWGEKFIFYRSGQFRFDYSQYDGSKRIIDFSGDWKIENGQLILTVQEQTVVRGGKLQKASPPAVTEYEIVGGKTIKEPVDPPRKIRYGLGKIKENKDYPHPVMIKINGKQYWKFYDDPNDLD